MKLKENLFTIILLVSIIAHCILISIVVFKTDSKIDQLSDNVQSINNTLNNWELTE